MSHGICKACKKSIIWIQTPAGKNMPVDPGIKFYVLNRDGQHKLVTPGGKVIICDLVEVPEKADGMGYVPHWATCKHVEKIKTPAKLKKKRLQNICLF